jgi:SAM-dependent methyltransferase
VANLGFDDAYVGTPPWDIGRPQPAFERFAAGGGLHGRVLDVGCGTGEHAMMAAAFGFTAVGLDASPRAIERARHKAEERGRDVRFVVGDALDLAALGERFDTVLDSGLFHVFDDDDRARYVAGLAGVIPPGGRFVLLCFSDRVPGELGPRRIREDAIRASFAEGWRVLSIDLVTMSVLFAEQGIPAWLAVIERT